MIQIINYPIIWSFTLLHSFTIDVPKFKYLLIDLVKFKYLLIDLVNESFSHGLRVVNESLKSTTIFS